MVNKNLNLEFEKAVRMLADHMPASNEQCRKPLLPHDIRVGVYLYENGYPRDIVLAGLLHDTLEFTTITEEILKEEFGHTVLALVRANTKDDSLTDKEEKTEELIKRCVAAGQDALITKAADIMDSFKYYTAVGNNDQLEYCLQNARAIFKYKPDNFQDRIFAELQKWVTESYNGQ